MALPHLILEDSAESPRTMERFPQRYRVVGWAFWYIWNEDISSHTKLQIHNALIESIFLYNWKYGQLLEKYSKKKTYFKETY